METWYVKYEVQPSMCTCLGRLSSFFFRQLSVCEECPSYVHSLVWLKCLWIWEIYLKEKCESVKCLITPCNIPSFGDNNNQMLILNNSFIVGFCCSYVLCTGILDTQWVLRTKYTVIVLIVLSCQLLFMSHSSHN